MTEKPRLIKPSIKKQKKLKVDDSVISKIKDLSNLGFEQDQIADYFGLDEQEWFFESSQYPEIKEAVMIGRSRGVMNSALKLRDHINKGNLKATTFYLETKGGFNKPDPKLLENKKEEKESIIDKMNRAVGPNETSRTYQEIMME